MREKIEFYRQVKDRLAQFDPGVLEYNKDEFWMIQSPYEYVEHYALDKGLFNTAVALPLARGLHNGVYRKSSIQKRGIYYRLPYVIHCLLVCRMLIDLQIPLSHEDEDVLLAASLCHDMIEDIPFPDHGMELTTVYHLDPRVYETVKLVSKRHDFTPEEEEAHFHGIEENKLSLLVKLSDRSQNVEDLYNMKYHKVHEYVAETNRFFDEMCMYGLLHFSELKATIEIIYDKIFSLTKLSEALVERCEARERELEFRLSQLKAENERLRQQYRSLWEG